MLSAPTCHTLLGWLGEYGNNYHTAVTIENFMKQNILTKLSLYKGNESVERGNKKLEMWLVLENAALAFMNPLVPHSTFKKPLSLRGQEVQSPKTLIYTMSVRLKRDIRNMVMMKNRRRKRRSEERRRKGEGGGKGEVVVEVISSLWILFGSLEMGHENWLIDLILTKQNRNIKGPKNEQKIWKR